MKFSSGWARIHLELLPSDATSEITPRVLRFEASRRARPPRQVLGLGFQAQPRNLSSFSGETTGKTPRTSHDLHAKHRARQAFHLPVYSVLPRSMTWSPRSSRRWFCGQTNKPRVQASVVSRHLAPASRPRTSFGCEPLPRTGSTPPRSFLPPCEPHLIHLATGSLEPSLLVSPLPGGHHG